MSEGDPKAVPAIASSPVGGAALPAGEELAGLISSRSFPSLRRSAALRPGALSRHRFTSCRHASALASLVPAAVVCAITAHIKSPATVNLLSAAGNLPSATVNLPSAAVNLTSAPLILASAAVGKLSAPVTLLSAAAVDGSPTAADTCLGTERGFPTSADGWFGSADDKMTGARTNFPSAHAKFSSSVISVAAASHSTRAAEAKLLTSAAFLPHPGPLPLGEGRTPRRLVNPHATFCRDADCVTPSPSGRGME